jgi:hypothetical protein
MIINSYQFAAPAGSLLLDTYTGAVGAFSLRQLRTAQTNCVTVRRASDNTEQTIGFSSGDIDATALTTFASGTNADVKTWFNQIGSNDVSQSTASKQPRIVTSGSIETDGADYGVKFVKTDADILTGNILSASKVYTIFAVCKIVTASDNFVLHLNGTASGYGLYTQGGQWKPFNRGVADFGTGAYSTNTVLITICRKSDSDIVTRLNGTQTFSGANSSMITPSGTFYLGGGDFGDTFGGHILEWICYDSDQSSNISAIEADIQSYYTNV